jgi:hypothetical protein
MIQGLYEGLYLQFIRRNSETGMIKTTECPISAFPRIGESRNLELKLVNTPSCAPFSENPVEVPILRLGNRISHPSSYLEGTKVVDWRGNLVQSPQTTTFVPEVQLGLTLTMKGFDFMGDVRKP